MEGIKGEDAPNYRKVVGKGHIHGWMDTHYGRPKVCEGVEGMECRGISKVWFDWALKKGKTYQRNRENFLRLCRSCHIRYDFTRARKRQAVTNLKKYNPYYGTEARVG